MLYSTLFYSTLLYSTLLYASHRADLAHARRAR